jgi:demethylmenaquinone methyltransferase/2-methoxy-6-polyprenyl-1,4-benzoquinol methylase
MTSTAGPNLSPIQNDRRDDAYVQALFDRMGPTYGLVNIVSSFGFSEFWRHECVKNANVEVGTRVCDMMAGSGECWDSILKRGGVLTSVDFSQVMNERQNTRKKKLNLKVDVRCENALQTTIESNSIDCVVSAFGLKTLSPDAVKKFALETRRILKPGGRISLLEISTAEGWFFSPLYRWYLRFVIPVIGKLCLGDIECYRMLGTYTEEFVSCDRVVAAFSDAGLRVVVRQHFYGCATSLVGTKTTNS